MLRWKGWETNGTGSILGKPFLWDANPWQKKSSHLNEFLFITD